MGTHASKALEATHEPDPAPHERAVLSRTHQLLRSLGGKWKAPVMYIDGFLDEDLERHVYEALRRHGGGKEIYVVLSSKGGSVAVARKIVHLLREYFDSYDVVIPFRAASAASLICLGARCIGMGSMSEIGPIDAHLSGSNGSDSGLLSAADIEAIQPALQSWFGLRGYRFNARAVERLSKQVFLPSIGAAHRASNFVRSTALDFLAYQVPGPMRKRRRIVEFLCSRDAHEYPITWDEAAAIGLNVARLTSEEESEVWAAWQSARAAFAEAPGMLAFTSQPTGVILAPHFTAVRRQHLVPGPDGTPEGFIKWDIVPDCDL